MKKLNFVGVLASMIFMLVGSAWAGETAQSTGKLGTEACRAHFISETIHLDCWADEAKTRRALDAVNAPEMRIVAFNYMITMGAQEQTFLADTFRREQDAHVSRYMAEALGETENPVYLPVLHERLLNSSHSNLVYSVLYALGRIKSPTSVPVIVKCMESPHKKQYLSAYITALGKIGSAEIIPILRSFSQKPDPMSPNYTYGHLVVGVLGEIGDPSALDVVLDVHRKPHLHDQVINATIEAMGRMGVDWTVQEIHPYANDPDYGIRRTVARALGRLKQSASESYLVHMAIQDGKSSVRQEAVRSLRHYSVSFALGSILQNDSEPMVRQEAAQSLVFYGGPQSKQLLENALMTERDPLVRAAIESGLNILK